MTRALCAIGAILVAHACTSPSTSEVPVLRIQTDAAVYAPGTIVAMTLVNVSDATLAYNGCAAVLERRVGGSWVSVPPSPNATPCNLITYPLEPEEQVVAHHALPPDIPPGTYRYRFEWVSGPSGEELPPSNRVSNTFDVSP